MTSFALKWIAVVTMLIDHIGVALVPRDSVWYIVCRSVGRLAFPLFAFMLAEGYFYTKNFRKYFTRLTVFAIVSEIPFDMMLHGEPVYWGSQNIFFTLLLALGGIAVFDRLAAGGRQTLSLFSLIITAFAAEILNTDYGAFGILTVFIFYRYRGERKALAAWFTVFTLVFAALNAFGNLPNTRSVVLSLIGGFAALSVIPMLLYNRQKGYSSKFWQYFFYAFYPVHMAVLYFMAGVMG